MKRKRKQQQHREPSRKKRASCTCGFPSLRVAVALDFISLAFHQSFISFQTLLCFSICYFVLCFVIRNTKKLHVQFRSLLTLAPPLLAKNSYQVDEPSLILSKAKLESLVVSAEVCDALKDEKLQKLIYMIDAATSSENELDKAMELEEFRNFTEKILSVVGP